MSDATVLERCQKARAAKPKKNQIHLRRPTELIWSLPDRAIALPVGRTVRAPHWQWALCTARLAERRLRLGVSGSAAAECVAVLHCRCTLLLRKPEPLTGRLSDGDSLSLSECAAVALRILLASCQCRSCAQPESESVGRTRTPTRTRPGTRASDGRSDSGSLSERPRRRFLQPIVVKRLWKIPTAA